MRDSAAAMAAKVVLLGAVVYTYGEMAGIESGIESGSIEYHIVLVGLTSILLKPGFKTGIENRD